MEEANAWRREVGEPAVRERCFDDAEKEFSRAKKLIDEVLSKRLTDEACQRLDAHIKMNRGIIESCRGDFPSAEAYLEEAIRILRPGPRR